MDQRVHVFDTGRLVANRTFLRGEGVGSLLRRREDIGFPALAFVIEHSDGLVAIDTGLAADAVAPRRLRGFPPAPFPGTPLAAQMRERGLDRRDVRRVVLTHLDWDHTGGLRDFPQAEVLLNRPEHDFGKTRLGRARYGAPPWPCATVYDLDPEPYGPFETSRAIADDLRVVPLPGHSPGQVGVVYERGDDTLLFAADHMLRADWFAEDLEAGRLVMLGAFAKAQSRDTSRRLQELVRSRPIVLLPAHDADAPDRLLRRVGAPAAAQPSAG